MLTVPILCLTSYRLVAFQPAFVSCYDVEQGPIKPMTDKLTGSAKWTWNYAYCRLLVEFVEKELSAINQIQLQLYIYRYISFKQQYICTKWMIRTGIRTIIQPKARHILISDKDIKKFVHTLRMMTQISQSNCRIGIMVE